MIVILLTFNTAQAEEIILFDNWNTAGCNTTNQSKFSINKEAFVSRIVMWSNTRLDGGNLSGTLSGPQGSRSISSTRGNCDPYQHHWCEQIFTISSSLPAGNYSINLNNNSVCQNGGSRGNGFAKVYGQHRQQAQAKEIILFDNWNTAGCNTTNQSKFSINKEAFVSHIVMWSNASVDGGNLSGTLSGTQGSINISSKRGNCDPYQHQWCEQIFTISRTLPAGNYSINLNKNSVCQNGCSRGNGFAKIYGH